MMSRSSRFESSKVRLALLARWTQGSVHSSVRGDALKLPFADAEFDYVMCSLFTHHLLDEQVVDVLREMSRVAKRRIFVIDLHRHPVAYLLYTTLGKIVLHNRLLRHDGALSILRSFKRGELLELAQRARLRDVSVERHFPYRLVLSAAARASVKLPESEVSSSRAA